MQILIRWLHQKPSDLDLLFFKEDISWFSRVRVKIFGNIITPDRQQSKTLLTVDECRSKIAINSAFDWHLSPVGQQTANENSVSNDFLPMFLISINVFYCHISGVIMGAVNCPDRIQ